MAKGAFSVFVLALHVACVLSGNVTEFPEGMIGSWKPKVNVTPQAILGPLAHDFIGFTAQRDPNTTDVWFTVLSGQVFRISGSQMQYCFGPYGFLVEQSPFTVNSTSQNDVTFCWREGLRGMPTQKKDCRGCDCASIKLVLTDPDTLRFTFWMSAPITHADAIFTRSGSAPDMSKISSTMKSPYDQCTFKDHYGPNLPGEPDLKPNKSSSQRSPGCAAAVVARMKNDDVSVAQALTESSPAKSSGICRQLNGMNFLLDAAAKKSSPAHVTNVRDIRLQYIKPALPCDPCDVSYSVSAQTDEDEFIGFGFKGQSWEHKFPYPPETSKRPCYFGMCVDSYDNYTSDRIALGYASSSGSCMREMVSKNYAAAPVDVDYKILKNTSVERSSGRTILRFTVSQHWPDKKFSIMPDGEFRIMWAIGKVQGEQGCTAALNYHGVNRGTSPLYWLDALYAGQSPASSGCKYSEYEMGEPHPLVIV